MLTSLPRDPQPCSLFPGRAAAECLGGPGPKPHSLCMSERFLACPRRRIQRSADFPALGEKGDALCQACAAAFALSLAAGGRAVPEPVPCLPGGLWRCLLACQDLLRRRQLLGRLGSLSVLLPSPVVQPMELCFGAREGHLPSGQHLWAPSRHSGLGSSPPSCTKRAGLATAVMRFAR